MAGSIPTLSVTMSALLNWQASKNDPLLATRPSNNQLGLSAVNSTWQNVTGLPLPPANQCKAMQVVVQPSSTTNIDLSAASKNIMEDPTATLFRIFAAVLWLPTTTQLAALGISIQASSVTIGGASSNIANLFGLADSSSSFTLNTGEIRSWQTPNVVGYPITTSQKNLLFTNNDSANQATLLLALVGSDQTYAMPDFTNPNNSMFFPLMWS